MFSFLVSSTAYIYLNAKGWCQVFLTAMVGKLGDLHVSCLLVFSEGYNQLFILTTLFNLNFNFNVLWLKTVMDLNTYG